jgi:hypothetical protein
VDTEQSKYGRTDCLAGSPDGIHLAAAADQTLTVWDVKTGKVAWRQRVLTRPSSYISAVTYSPEGKVLAAAVKDRGVVRLYNATSGRELRRLALPGNEEPWSAGLAYSPDGRFVAVGLRRVNVVHVWDAASGKHSAALRWKNQGERKPGDVGSFSLAISPDGKTIAVDCVDRQIRLFEVVSGGLRHTLKAGNPSMVTVGVKFCSGGRLLRPGWQGTGRVNAVRWLAPAAPGRLKPEELRELWVALGSKDAATGFAAAVKLLGNPEQAVTLLSRLPRIEAVTDKQLAKWIAGLDDDDPDVRLRSTEELQLAGAAAEKALRAVLGNPPSLEVKKRASALLANLTPLRPERLRFLRAVEMLDALGNAEAQKQLERLAKGRAAVEETEDARAALARVRKRPKD